MSFYENTKKNKKKKKKPDKSQFNRNKNNYVTNFYPTEQETTHVDGLKKIRAYETSQFPKRNQELYKPEIGTSSNGSNYSEEIYGYTNNFGRSQQTEKINGRKVKSKKNISCQNNTDLQEQNNKYNQKQQNKEVKKSFEIYRHTGIQKTSLQMPENESQEIHEREEKKEDLDDLEQDQKFDTKEINELRKKNPKKLEKVKKKLKKDLNKKEKECIILEEQLKEKQDIFEQNYNEISKNYRKSKIYSQIITEHQSVQQQDLDQKIVLGVKEIENKMKKIDEQQQEINQKATSLNYHFQQIDNYSETVKKYREKINQNKIEIYKQFYLMTVYQNLLANPHLINEVVNNNDNTIQEDELQKEILNLEKKKKLFDK
ncbi:hypothetical protein M0812_21266 [Anaeramoeba flamelloides]|uniref:DUF4200 domain-containing protein n=1 Tax=Anaeramoeba flamelloides TaxID=1746091 RepID=A0AAV7YWT0_9EUKA|nr:hypothetical protein M0812_21266 [Anaeramoeba flamelloides]